MVRARAVPVLVAVFALASAATTACGEEATPIPDPDASPPGDPNARDDGGRVSPGSDGGTAPPADGGIDANDAGELEDAGVDAEVDAGLDAGPTGPVMLYDTPQPGAIGRRLFVKGKTLYWQYDVGDKSFIARGTSDGEARIDVVESDEPISPADVREVIVYQTKSGKLWSRAASAEIATPIELEKSPGCNAVTSSKTHVFCRGVDATIVRWTLNGQTRNVIASSVPAGPDLVTDDSTLYLTEDQGNVSRMSVNGFIGGGAPVGPPLGTYVVLAKDQTKPRGLIVGVPFDDVVYWMEGTDDAARVRACSKVNGSNASTAGPALDGAKQFTQYSPRAGVFVELEAVAGSTIGFVRFGDSAPPRTLHEVPTGVADLASTSYPGEPVYWLDDDARVWVSPP